MKLYSLKWWILFMLTTYFLIIYDYNIIKGWIENSSIIGPIMINLSLLGLGGSWMFFVKEPETKWLSTATAKLILFGTLIIGCIISYIW